MAWNKESKAARRARVAKQLRDKHGKWIEMGGGVKWFKDGSWHNGTASAFEGSNVVVKMADGSEQRINHRQIEPIRAKGSLGAKPAKPTGSVQAKKSAGRRSTETASIKDNDPGKRLTTNASDLEEGDEVHLIGSSSVTGKYGINDKDAAAFEDRGFEIPLDDKQEPIRARVVDTSGDSVTVEDAAGKQHQISKSDNVIADDPEVDAALQNRDENPAVPDEVDDFDMASVDPKKLNIPAGATAAYKKGVTASKGGDLEKAEKSFEAKNGEEFSDDFTVGYLDGQHIADGAREKFQGLYHKYAAAAERDGSSEPEQKAAIKERATSSDKEVTFDGLGLSDEEKAHINSAETGEDAIKRLAESEAGEAYKDARKINSDANKKFVADYRKASKDLADKYEVGKNQTEEAPKAEEAPKSGGTPIEALQKSVANLSEDLAEIDSQGLDAEAEAVALKEAAYDFKSDDGEVFNLTGSRDETGDWQLDISDSDNNHVASLKPKDSKSPQALAQAIKDSTKDNSSAEKSEAPTEAPETPAEEAPKAEEATPTGAFADRIESVRDKLSAIAKDAFDNNNTATEHVDLGDGKIVEVSKGMDKGKVAGLTVKMRDKVNVGNTSITTDQKGSQTSRDPKGFEESVDRLKEVVAHIESRKAIFGDDTPEAKKFAQEETAKRLEKGNKEIEGRKSAEKVSKLHAEVNDLPIDDPRKRAYDSARDNAEDTVNEGTIERDSKEYNDLILSSYDSTLDDIKAEDAAKASDGDNAESTPGTVEHLEKALEDAGFSDADIVAISNAASTDESEADKQFFQSEVGQSNNVEPSEEFKAARKALDDFMKANNENVKGQNEKSDQTRQDSADEKARADELDSPEAVARGAKETIDSGKQRDEDRAAKNTDEAKLAELDRKIGVGEKMLADAEAKENAPLVQRLTENLVSLKKQREKLAPTEEAASEESEATGFTPGALFDVPEGGVSILSNKGLEKQTADFLKTGDKLFARVDENGTLRPILGNDMRVTPDGDSYAVTGVNKTSSKTSVTVKDSKGKLHLFEFGVGDRKKNVVLDTKKNRESLGLTDKSAEPEAPAAPAEKKEPAPRSAKAPLSQEMLDNLPDGARAYARNTENKSMGYYRKKDGEWFKEKNESNGPVDLPDSAKLFSTPTGDMTFHAFSGETAGIEPQDIISATMPDGSEARAIVDKVDVKNQKVVARVMGARGEAGLEDIATDRIQSLHRLKDDDTYYSHAGDRGDSKRNQPEDVEKEAPTAEDMGEEVAPEEVAIPEEDIKPKAEVTDEAIDGVMRGITAQEQKLKVETTDELVSQLRGGSLTDGRSINLVKDENGNLAWEAREKDGTPIGQVPYMDEKRFVDTEKRNAALRDLLNGTSSSDEVPAEKDPEEEKLAEDFIAENPEETQDASEGPTPEEIKSTLEEALSDIDDDLIEFGGDSSWDDLKERTWPINESEEGSQQYIALGEGSSDTDRFLGLYDATTNEELETFDMEGNSTNGPEDRDTDDTGAGDGGGDDSRGGEVPGGDGPDSGAGDGDGESSSGDSVDPAAYDAQAASLVRAVSKGLIDSGENVQLDDEYSAEYTVDTYGKETYRLYDSNGRTLVKIARTNEDRLGEILRGYSDADRKLHEAFTTEPGSDGRRVTPTRQMQKMADIGTYFENDRGDRFTKITAYSWGMSKAGDNSDNKNMGIIEGHGRFGSGEMTLGHHVDHHRPHNEIEAMSDDELRQNIADFGNRIHSIIEVDGKIGDKQGQGSLAQGIRDQENMQRFRYESRRLNEEAADYAKELWKRLRENGAHADGKVDIGDFNSSPEIPFTNKDASIDDNQWTAVRNEYVGLDHRTLKHNFELRNSEKPSRGAVAWANKMDKWARSGELAEDFTMFRSVLASPDAATEFAPGKMVVDKGVMSLADNLHTAEVYLDARITRTAGKIPIVMEVQGRKGEKMTAAGFGSDELVVPRGSKLFIASAEMDDQGILRVTARLNPSDAEVAEWTNKSALNKPSAPEVAPEAPKSSLKPLTKLTPESSNAETAAFAEEYWEERAHLTPERAKKFEVVEKATEDMELEQLDAEERGDFAQANKLEAEIDALRSDLQDEIIANRAERIAAGSGEATPEAPKASPQPKTPVGIPAKDPDNPVNGEDGFQQIDGSPLKGKPSGRFTQVEGFENGDRVFHGKHGAGTIVKRESNGQFARILFDKDQDTGKVMGISLTKVTKGESAAPEAEAPKSPAKTITPRPTTVKEGSTAEIGEWKNGERVNHGKHGAGTIKRLEGNGEYARVEFDGAAGTKGIKLTQLGRGDSAPAPSRPETPTKVKTPKVPKAPLASAPEGSPGQIGGWTLGDKLTHKSKGSGTLKSFGKDGTFGMIEFDNEPGVQRGIRFSGLTKSDTSTPSQIADPPTIVNGPDGEPVNSGDTDTRNAGEDPSTSKPVEDKNGAELYVGAVVVHPQLGRGRVVKVGNSAKPSIQVIFDNDPTGKPKSLSGARLKDIAIAPKGASDKTSL